VRCGVCACVWCLTLLSALLIGSSALPAAESSPFQALDVRRKLLSQSTLYCYLDANGNIASDSVGIGCDGGMPQGASACMAGTSVSSASPCALGDNLNGVDVNRWENTYAFDHCEDVVIYTLADGAKRGFCRRLASTGAWHLRRRDTAGSGRQATTSDSWWGCGWWWQGTTWHNGKCHDSKRYLGESCWDNVECDNSGVDSYAGLHMSCATVPPLEITSPTCIPSAFEIERNKCHCGWFDWYVGFACGAADGACNGHPCVYSTGSGDYSCDYQANNDW